MSRVITFSRTFPAYHPKAGQETYFIEKFWQSLYNVGKIDNCLGSPLLEKEFEVFSNPSHFIIPKYHTIRAGNRWKVGDKFSPRVWSGKPYASKQICIAPDTEVKRIWNIRIEIDEPYHVFVLVLTEKEDTFYMLPTSDVARNDGLSFDDFKAWFKPYCKKRENFFLGQIICWDENVNYND